MSEPLSIYPKKTSADIRAVYTEGMKTTEAQAARTHSKDSSGRFKKNRCECCKKPAPMDYFSAGPYVVLCEKCCIRIEAEG